MTINKSKWPLGPWTSEPDFKEWVTATGYRGVVLRHFETGYLCGYVELPLAHPLAGVDRKFDGSDHDLDDKLPCHGGVTFVGDLPGIKGMPRDYGWGIGFDAGHFGDETPNNLLIASTDQYRDIEYMTKDWGFA